MKTWTLVVAILVTLAWYVSSYSEAGGGEEVFFKNDAGDEFYYEPNSITQKQGSPVVTVQARGASSRPDAPLKGFNQTIEINCTQRLYRKVESQITRSDGTVYSEQPSPVWISATAETSAYRLLVDAVCRKARIMR